MKRRKRLLEILGRRSRVTLSRLRAALGVSPATLRRDLSLLARDGLVVRTHGGVIHPASLVGEPVYQRRARVASEAKRAIGAAAAKIVPENAVVFIDAGSTAFAVARRLIARKDVTLVTNSLPLVQAAQIDGARIIATGGDLRVPSQSFTGALALEWLGRLRFDFSFIGASGLHALDGASVTSLEEAAVKRAAMLRSKIVVLVADATKWDKPAAIGFAPWGEFHFWYTDTRIDVKTKRRMKRRGLNTHVVSVEE